MAESNSSTIRSVAWSEIFPWLSIVRAFRLAIAIRTQALASLGILLTVTVWGVIGMVFGTDSEATQWLQPFAECPWTALTKGYVSDQPEFPTAIDAEKIARPWTLLTSPATEGLGRTDFSVRALACLILCGLWGAAVWAFFGAAICRTAALRLAADEQIGVSTALRYAGRKWPAYVASPLLPLGGVLLAAIPILVLGWLMRTSPGLVLGGFLWPLVIVGGFLMAVLLIGTLFGWPLMWGAISVEGTDSFDALSRSYAYVFQRPLRYLFYIAVAAVVGWIGWLLVRNFAAGIVWLGYWAAGWGCGSEQIKCILSGSDELSGVGQFGAGMIRFWAGCIKLLAVGYLFNYFWTASTAVYLLLRHDVDATEMDEVFLDADATEQEPSLPTVADDGSTGGNGGT